MSATYRGTMQRIDKLADLEVTEADLEWLEWRRDQVSQNDKAEPDPGGVKGSQ